MDNNEEVGLKTNQTNKLVHEANNRLRSAQVDYDFYSTSFAYFSVEEQSANNHFGAGKWKQNCKASFGESTFDEKADKYGNKPIDFKIAAFVTDQVKYFNASEQISITDKNGIYTGSGKVLATDKTHVIVMMPFYGTSTGKITNVSRMMGAQKAVEKYSQIISDIEPSKEKAQEQKKEELNKTIAKFSQAVANENTATQQAVISTSQKYSGILKLAGIAVAIIIVLAIINHYSKKEK
jgi:hypothetical protein